MKKISVQLCTALILLIVIMTQVTTQAHAVALDSIGIASYYPLNAKNIENGDIISAGSKGYFKSDKPYDPQVIGIVTLKPAISLRTTNDKNMYPVVNAGMVNTQVSGMGGNIKKGDFISTSTIPGAGMKATGTGYVIGAAMEDVTFKDKNEVKVMTIDLNMHYVQVGAPITNSLLDVFNLSKIATYEQPLRVFQYVAATLVLVISFIFGFLIFAKVVNTGVEALGRNPLAGKMIQLSIVFNVILIIAIILSGASIAYLIIRL